MGIFANVEHYKKVLYKINEGIDYYNKMKSFDPVKFKKRYGDNLTRVLNEKLEWEKELNKRINFINRTSTFNCDIIGYIIAELISKIEGEEYSYYKAIFTATTTKSLRSGIEETDQDYVVFLINRQKDIKNRYNDTFEEGMKSTIFISNPDLIMLKGQRTLFNIEEKSNAIISFYDYALNKLIGVKRYNYVYDFIDFVIEYAWQKRTFIITKEELYELLEKFILNYEKEEDKVKIIGAKK